MVTAGSMKRGVRDTDPPDRDVSFHREHPGRCANLLAALDDGEAGYRGSHPRCTLTAGRLHGRAIDNIKKNRIYQ